MAGEDELLSESGVPIRPPRLEDAGLEDCALPPESIAEAFSLAASAVSSRLARFALSDDEDDEDDLHLLVPRGCVDDAAPARGSVPDALVGGGGVVGHGGADEVVVVGGQRGGGAEDAVVVGGRGEDEDRVVVVGEGRGEKTLGEEEGCVEGIGEGIDRPRRAQGGGEGENEEVEVAVEKAVVVPDFA